MITISKKIVNDKPKSLSSAYSAPFRKFVLGLLEKDIAKRPSMVELLRSDFISKHANKAPASPSAGGASPEAHVGAGGGGEEDELPSKAGGGNRFLSTVRNKS